VLHDFFFVHSRSGAGACSRGGAAGTATPLHAAIDSCLSFPSCFIFYTAAQLLLQGDGVVDGAGIPENAPMKPSKESARPLVLLGSQRRGSKVQHCASAVLLSNASQTERDERDCGAVEWRSRVRLRRHATDVLCLGRSGVVSLLFHSFIAIDCYQAMWSSCRATAP
jgi:hypothetical protein